MKVYVGTYAKYNKASLEGAWLDVSDYSDKEEFLEACRDLHNDESDPELMFQDFDTDSPVPKDFYGECHIEERIWDFLKLSEEDQNLVFAYKQDASFLRCEDVSDVLSEANDHLVGVGNSEREIVEWSVDDCGMLDDMPDHLRSYFDMGDYVRDFMFGHFSTRVDGKVYVFSY